MDNFIRTHSNSQVLPPEWPKERARKAWRFAEFSAKVFFLLEACVDRRRDIELLQYLTTDVAEAYRLEKELVECRWSRVNVFMRFRDLTKQDLTYEELNAAYRSRINGASWYQLSSGHLIGESGAAGKNLTNLKDEFDLVYLRRGAKSELHSLPF